MRATVGPLSPAVYWRRRLVVLGALLLGVIVLFAACFGGDKPDPKKTATQATQFPTPDAKGQSTGASPTPSIVESVPPGGQIFPDPIDTSPDEETLPPPASGVSPAVPAGGSEACTDAEIAVTPLPADTSPQRGASTKIQLKVKNIGTRTCTRDLGASAQELYIEQGAQKFWSSDLCSTTKGNQVETLGAGAERMFEVTWNGRQSNQCANNVPSGQFPPAGAYSLRGRLDTKVSEPVVLTIVA